MDSDQIEYYIAKIKDGEKFYQMNYKDQIFFEEELGRYFESYLFKIYPNIKIHKIMIKPEDNTFGVTLSDEINPSLITGALSWKYCTQSYSSSDKYWYLFKMEERV